MLLRMKEEEINFGHLVTFWFGSFAMIDCATKSLVGHENTQNEWYVVIKVTVFETLKDLLHYHISDVCAIPTYTVYRLY